MSREGITFEVVLGPELREMLSLPQTHEYFQKTSIPLALGTRISSSIDMTAGIHSIYVYSDIIKHSYVGNSMAQLLRRVDVPLVPYGAQISHIFPAPHYHLLCDQTFGSIEIVLKDDADRLIPFRFGRSIVTLHFRRVADSFNYGQIL